MKRTELKHDGPADFGSVLTRLKQTSEQVHYRVSETWATRTMRVGNLPWLVTLGQPALDPSLPWELETWGGTHDDFPLVVETLRRMFGLDQDLQKIIAMMQGNPALASLAPTGGTRLMSDPSLFEAVMGSIISQQLNLSFCAVLKQRFLELCGDTADFGTQGVWRVFPTPEAVAGLRYEQLRALQFSQRKAEYVIDFARAVVDGSIELESLSRLDDETAIETLTRIRGIGRWSAECILLFGLGRPDVLPALDIGLRNAVTKAYHLDHQATEAEVRELAESWRPWRSWVTYYLWLSLAQSQEQGVRSQESGGNERKTKDDPRET
jgi:DNA-3-methyladenine glycosylase II